MSVVRFPYSQSNRILAVVATTSDFAGTVYQVIFHGRGWRPKLLLAVLVGVIVFEIGQLTLRFILGSQSAFFRLQPVAHISKPAAAATAAAADRPQLSLPPFVEHNSEYSDAKLLGKQRNSAIFGAQHWPALERLWQAESGWNPRARNVLSGACGIPQALPCSKIPDQSAAGQIQWGLDYIKRRYGNPTSAWHFWQSHRWY